MIHPPTTVTRRRRPVALLAAAVLLAGTIAGCSSGDDSASTTSTTSADSGETSALATACREVDLAPITKSAADLDQARRTLEAAAGNDAEFTAATIAFLGTGQVFFTALATALDPFFDELARASGQSAVADVTADFATAADDFAALAPEIEAAGKVTPEHIAAIQAVNTKFDRFAEYVNAGSPSGDELRQIPTCTAFLRNLDETTSAISAADGKDELDTDG